jgi:ATP-dependent RNA helicase RhlE
MPNQPEDYIHRIGRTARAGASGVASSFVDGEELDNLRAIERQLGSELSIKDVEGFVYSPTRVVPSADRNAARVGGGGRSGGGGRNARSGGGGGRGGWSRNKRRG